MCPLSRFTFGVTKAVAYQMIGAPILFPAVLLSAPVTEKRPAGINHRDHRADIPGRGPDTSAPDKLLSRQGLPLEWWSVALVTHTSRPADNGVLLKFG